MALSQRVLVHLCIRCGMLTNIKLHLNYLSITRLIKSWSLTFATQMLFRRSGSELSDTFKNIILLRIFLL